MLQTLVDRIGASSRLGELFAGICDTGGRFAGTESEVLAREWLAARLAEATGRTVVREAIPSRGWTRGPSRVRAGGRELPAHALVRSPATPAGGLTATLVDLGRGAPEDFARAGEAVRGAIVMVRHELMFATGHIHRRRKYEMARAAGAAGFLIAFHEPGDLVVTGSSGDGGPGHIPAAGISRESGAALAGAHGTPVTLETSGVLHDAIAENLFATIPGKGPEVVVLSAHLDGHDLGESAIDNGTGLACALAVAEAMREIVPGLRRGLQVAFFTIEEWALMGSREHLRRLDPAARARIAFDVNLDSVAGADGLTALTSGFPGVAEFVRAATAGCGHEVGLHAPFMGNSDHANYVRAGIPALRLVAGFDQPRSPFRLLLTAGDTRDKVARHQLRAAAAVTAALLLAACDGERLPPHVDAATAAALAGG
ncbi:MAG: M28 family peptidase [Alphaproteobacteria bacterium]|nr:M28 family peptidase [Alphaproteobacteria bacterium]